MGVVSGLGEGGRGEGLDLEDDVRILPLCTSWNLSSWMDSLSEVSDSVVFIRVISIRVSSIGVGFSSSIFSFLFLGGFWAGDPIAGTYSCASAPG